MTITRECVLNEGYVELIGFLGDDDAPIDAARVSFGREASQFPEEQNDRLRKYLLKHHHETPFEMVTFKFRIRAPVMVWWHLVRHRMASFNLISGRYTEFEETSVYRPEDNEWRLQSIDNKQGSDGLLPEWPDNDNPDSWCGRNGAQVNDKVEYLYKQCFRLYDKMLTMGIAREQARLVLPFAAVYYEGIVQINARSLMNFLRLRTSGDAQSETRDYAEAIKKIVQQTHPKTFQEI